jgi:hypothetical protein
MRPVPAIGMEVSVIHLGGEEDGVVEDVRDGGRTVVVSGEAFALHRMTGHWVRVGDPYYGRRLSLVRHSCD